MPDLFMVGKVLTLINHKITEGIYCNVTSIANPNIAYLNGSIDEKQLLSYLNQDLKLIGFPPDESIPKTIYMKLTDVNSGGLEFSSFPKNKMTINSTINQFTTIL